MRDGRIRRRALAAAAAAAVSALGAGAGAGLAHGHRAANQDHHGGPRLRASLRLSDERVPVGRKVVLDSSHSRGRVVYHLWDLDGDGVYETSTKRRARLRHAFDRAGSHRVGVVVMDRHGGYSVRRARVKVVKPERRHRSSHRSRGAERGRRAHVHAATKGDGGSKPARQAKPAAPAPSAPAPATGGASPDLHAAATSNSVTIKNFAFHPKGITVPVGTTVTWTNQDTTGHTATADDGTFDTGLLSKGATRNFTFNKAGTYQYHCTPHPTIMKATVTVTGSGGSSSPGDHNSSSGSGSNTSGSSSTKHSSLPHTGLEIGSFVLAGLALLGAGAAIRRRVARA